MVGMPNMSDYYTLQKTTTKPFVEFFCKSFVFRKSNNFPSLKIEYFIANS